MASEPGSGDSWADCENRFSGKSPELVLAFMSASVADSNLVSRIYPCEYRVPLNRCQMVLRSSVD